MDLEVPLTQLQVDAAKRLHAGLKQWRTSDGALRELREKLPGFTETACLTKTVAVNAIYGTNVMAVVRLADHVYDTLKLRGDSLAEVEIVEQLAALPPLPGEKRRRFTSFAAKFCHFFIDDELFPIYDDAAREALKLHLGWVPKAHDYQSFCRCFKELHQIAALSCSTRELDRYLWLTGMYMRWKKNPRKALVNSELRVVLEHPTPQQRRDLTAMLPPLPNRAIKRRAR